MEKRRSLSVLHRVHSSQHIQSWDWGSCEGGRVIASGACLEPPRFVPPDRESSLHFSPLFFSTNVCTHLHANVVTKSKPVTCQDERLIHSVLWWRHRRSVTECVYEVTKNSTPKRCYENLSTLRPANDKNYYVGFAVVICAWRASYPPIQQWKLYANGWD